MQVNNKYVAIAWYKQPNSQKMKYLLFDTSSFEIKLVSEEALALIHNQVLNIHYEEYIDHLTPVWRFYPKDSFTFSKTDISIKYEVKEEFGQKYTYIKIDNIMKKTSDTRIMVTELIVPEIKNDEYNLYNGLVIQGYSGCDYENKNENSYIIEIRKKIGFRVDKSNSDGNSSNFMFKRGFTNVNLNNEVNQHLLNRNNKIRLLGKDIINYEYIENNGIWLIKMDLDKEKDIQIPSCIDYIGYNLFAQLLKRVSNNKRNMVLSVNKKQLDSMKYSISIAPSVEFFGFKAINLDQVKEQFSNALNNHRIIVRES